MNDVGGVPRPRALPTSPEHKHRDAVAVRLATEAATKRPTGGWLLQQGDTGRRPEPSRPQSWGAVRCRHAPRDSAAFETYEFFVSGTFHLAFSDLSRPRVTEATQSGTEGEAAAVRGVSARAGGLAGAEPLSSCPPVLRPLAVSTMGSRAGLRGTVPGNRPHP